MPFETDLFKITQSEATITFNDQEVDRHHAIPTLPGNFTIWMGWSEPRLEFDQQRVTVDENGNFTATSTSGLAIEFTATKMKPILESDLL